MKSWLKVTAAWTKVVSVETGELVTYFEETAAGFDDRLDVGCKSCWVSLSSGNDGVTINWDREGCKYRFLNKGEIRSLVLDIIKWRGLLNIQGFPSNSVGKESTCNAGDPSSIPGSGRSTGEGIGCPFQYSGMENSMDCMDSPWGCKESGTTERLSLFRGLLNILGYTRPNLRLGSCEHICNIWCRNTKWGTEGENMKQKRCKVRDLGSIPGLGRCPREGKGYQLQYSGLENSMDYTVHGVAMSWTWLKDFHFHFHRKGKINAY